MQQHFPRGSQGRHRQHPDLLTGMLLNTFAAHGKQLLALDNVFFSSVMGKEKVAFKTRTFPG